MINMSRKGSYQSDS